jgi:hypothetical protein
MGVQKDVHRHGEGTSLKHSRCEHAASCASQGDLPKRWTATVSLVLEVDEERVGREDDTVDLMG